MNQLRNVRLSTLFETAQKKTKEGYSYSVLRVNADKRCFFKLSEFQMLVSSSTGHSSEEAILLLVRVIRQSVKSVKNLMIKKRETGGMVVVFNLWWDYILCRIVNLSHDESVVRENLENDTAVMLFKELCGLITKDMGEVVKSGSHVDYIKDHYGIDSVSNAWNAAKVIDRCGGESHILNADG